MIDQVLDAYNDEPSKNKNQTIVSFKPNSNLKNDKINLEENISSNNNNLN